MNANELADCLEFTPTAKKFQKTQLEAATMLRQQQAEIEALKKFNKAILKKGGCDGNICQQYSTHPVKEQELLDEIAHLKHINRNWQISENILLLELEKLQDHPVKELTDEEINDIAQQCWVYPEREQAIFNQHKFARAILRKAQEK